MRTQAVYGALVSACLAFVVACPPPANLPNVITNAAACAVDVITDVTQTPTPALLAQTLADCGLTAAELYADIAALIANAQVNDAGTVTTRKGAVVSSVYVSHLQQWQALQTDAGAQ